jgi:NarL family two-component system response regulator LiaR
MMADPAQRISLVIADDHAVVRHGLSAFISLAEDIHLVAIANNSAAAIEAAALHVPDVFLLDLFMPDAAAAETVRRIKDASPRTQIVILTSHEGDEHVAEVTRAGAISYILKDCTPDELISTIRLAASGEAILSPRISKALLAALNVRKPSATPHEDLTTRELEVLLAIAEGLSNLSISTRLGIAEKTVKSHVGNILSKLYLKDRTQVAVYAWRQGLVGPVGPNGRQNDGPGDEPGR